MTTIIISHSKQNGISNTWSASKELTNPRALSTYLAQHFGDKWRISRLHRSRISFPAFTCSAAEITLVDRRDPPGTALHSDCCHYPRAYVAIEVV